MKRLLAGTSHPLACRRCLQHVAFRHRPRRLAAASTPGSPWRHDNFVPVMFAGAGLKARTVSRPVKPYDVAPADHLGVKPPLGSIGNPLVEIVGD